MSVSLHLVQNALPFFWTNLKNFKNFIILLYLCCQGMYKSRCFTVVKYWNGLHAHLPSCFSHVRLCNTMDYSLPSSSIHRLLQARILEWFAMSSFRYLSNLGIKTESLTSPALTDGFFTTSATWEAPKWPGSL